MSQRRDQREIAKEVVIYTHAVTPNGDIGIVLNRKKTDRLSELNKRKQGKLSVPK